MSGTTEAISRKGDAARYGAGLANSACRQLNHPIRSRAVPKMTPCSVRASSLRVGCASARRTWSISRGRSSPAVSAASLTITWPSRSFRIGPTQATGLSPLKATPVSCGTARNRAGARATLALACKSADHRPTTLQGRLRQHTAAICVASARAHLSRQDGDLGVGETTGAQHRLAMLVEARRCASGSARRPRKLDRGTEAAIGAEFRHHLAVRGMVGGHRLIDIEHRPRRQAEIASMRRANSCPSSSAKRVRKVSVRRPPDRADAKGRKPDSPHPRTGAPGKISPN